MRLEIGYTIWSTKEIAEDSLTGFGAAEGEISFQIIGREANGNWLAIGSCPIDPSGLEVVASRPTLSGGKTTAGFAVPRVPDVNELAHDTVDALAVCLRIPLGLSSRLTAHRLLPDSAEDEEIIISRPLVPQLSTIIDFIQPPVAKDHLDIVVRSLRSKQPGIALYNEALMLTRPVAQFRDYWRLLESAFGCSDEELVALLSEYPPALDLQFTPEEVTDLLVLRGMASHASGKKQREVVRRVQREVEKRLPRLRTLAERVLFTKKTWGVRTLAVHALQPLVCYPGPAEERLPFRKRK